LANGAQPTEEAGSRSSALKRIGRGRSDTGALAGPPKFGTLTDKHPCAAVGRAAKYNRMVARHGLTDEELDRLFRALADATRRDIVARVLAGEPASISTLAARYDMSFAAVQKHVAILEGAGLVTKHPQGRERIVRGNPERIARARALLTQLEGLWRARFSQLDSLFTDPSRPE
jgi:DNA-binding transcriptional ArsR family regulator